MVFGQLSELLKFSDRVTESLEIMERYRGKHIRIRKQITTEDDTTKTLFYDGRVIDVVAQPTGFLMQDITKYADGTPEADREPVDEKFVSFNDIEEIDVLDDTDT